MKQIFFLLSLMFLGAVGRGHAQVWNFEDRVPEGFAASDGQKLAVSDLFYKEGTSSLEWQFRPGGTLAVDMETPLVLSPEKEE